MKNMFTLYKICFIVLFQDNYALKDTLQKKNLQFVKNLKQDLLRNNDDYAELRRSITQTSYTQRSVDNARLNDIRRKIITTRDDKKGTKSDQSINKIYSTSLIGTASFNGRNNVTEDVRIKIIDNIRRRVNDALISKEVITNDADPERRANVVNHRHKASYNYTTPPNNNDAFDTDTILPEHIQPRPRSLWNDIHTLLQKNQDKVNRYRMKLLSNKTNGLPQTVTLKTTQFTNVKLYKKDAKKSEMEKFKKFIHENKGLLRDFISSKKHAAIMSPATPGTRHTFSKQTKQSKMVRGRKLNHIMRQATNGLNDKMSMTALPNAAMLDMFPAKGGRIHAKRLRGRLCHRHVLIPKGPKYNSLGKVYLAPHAAAHVGHEYNATEIPKLLLPRCCNCCRKSVLGCE